MSTQKRSHHALHVWRERLTIVTLIVVMLAALVSLGYVIRLWREPTRVVAISAPVPAGWPPASPTPPPVRREPPVPAEPIAIADARVTGNPHARIAVIEFAEPECPFCVRFHEGAYPELRSKYVDAGKVRLVYWPYPLEAIHQRALKASEAAECAGEQERFWEMLDLLLEDHKRLDDASLHARAERLGLDGDAFARCLDGQMTDKARRLAAEAERLMVQGTPTFFFGRVQPNGTVRVVERFSGAQPIARFDAVLTRLLAETGVEASR